MAGLSFWNKHDLKKTHIKVRGVFCLLVENSTLGLTPEIKEHYMYDKDEHFGCLFLHYKQQGKKNLPHPLNVLQYLYEEGFIPINKQVAIKVEIK